MSSLGPLALHRRARYRSGASGSSPVPVDGRTEMMGHCAGSGRSLRRSGMTPSVSTLQRLTRTMRARRSKDARDAEGVPHEARRLGVARRVMMPPTAVPRRRANAACARFLPRPRGERLIISPHAGAARSHWQLASEVAYQAAAPTSDRYRRRRPTIGPSPCRPKPRSSTWHAATVRTASDHGGLRLVREVPRGSASRRPASTR